MAWTTKLVTYCAALCPGVTAFVACEVEDELEPIDLEDEELVERDANPAPPTPPPPPTDHCFACIDGTACCCSTAGLGRVCYGGSTMASCESQTADEYCYIVDDKCDCVTLSHIEI